MSKLMNELSGLDKANIHSIMSVENDVTRLFNMMDHALRELCRLEDIMTNYEHQLSEDQQRVEEALQAYTTQQIRNNNTSKLLTVLEQLLEQSTFSEQVEDTLQNLPLKSASQISRLTEAVREIQEKREKCEASPLIDMTCVAVQVHKMDTLLTVFADRVVEAVSEITSPSWNAAQSIRHSKLSPLLPVVYWLAQHDPTRFNDLAAQYQVTAQQTYEKVLREYFDDKRSSVTRKSSEKLFSKFSSNKKSELALSQKTKSSTTMLNSRSSITSTNQSNTSLDSLHSGKSELDFQISQQGNMFECWFRDALDFVDITMNKEESFINHFFEKIRCPADRKHMTEIVLCRFNQELASYIQTAVKFDIYYSLPVYLSVLDRLDDTNPDTYLYKVLHTNMELANKLFNQMHKQQKAKILEVNRKAHRGTCNSVLQFTQFLLYADSLRKNSRRESLETSYQLLSEAVSEAIETFATEQSKAPIDVVIAENYHYIYHFLFRNKIECLDKFRSACHKEYKEHLEMYVKAHLGTPLDKINQFFDGVQHKINSGVPFVEIGFYPEFSKQKIKALTSEYTVKEIRKGLESIMKKIEKHFTKEQNLFKMACLTMQAEFIKQVEGYENLMAKCYPDAGLRFAFTIPEIHGIFDGKSSK